MIDAGHPPSAESWRTLEYDVSKHAGRTLQIVLTAAAGGPKHPWHNDRAYFDEIRVIAEGSSHPHRAAISDIAEADEYQPPDPATCLSDTLDWFVAHSDLFVFAQIMGPISALDWMLGTEDYLVWCMTDTHRVRRLSEKVIEYELARATTALAGLGGYVRRRRGA